MWGRLGLTHWCACVQHLQCGKLECFSIVSGQAHSPPGTNSTRSECTCPDLTSAGGKWWDSIFCGASDAQTRPVFVQNQPKIHFASSHARSCSLLGFHCLWHQYTCSCMSDGVMPWSHLCRVPEWHNSNQWARRRKFYHPRLRRYDDSQYVVW